PPHRLRDRRGRSMSANSSTPELIWYVSYGSNMLLARFQYYLSGGTPPGTTHVYPGCRDQQPARRIAATWLRGGMYFALESRVWGGGLGLYDPDLPGEAAA